MNLRHLMLRLVATFCVIAYSLTARGLLVEDLYQAQVLVVDQSEAALQDGVASGLQQVLIRVSGNVDVARHGSVIMAMRNPDRFYDEHHYTTTDRQLIVDGELNDAKLLTIRFEPNAVSRLLREAGFPVWGSERPGIMVWIAEAEDSGQRRMLEESDAGEVAKAFEIRSRERGLPLLWPLMDLEDTGQVSTAQIWGQFLGTVETASIRYRPDCILSGRVQRQGGRWVGRWSFQLDARWQNFDTVGFNPDEMVVALMDRITNQLAQRYAIDASRGDILLTVEAVDSLEAYAAVGRYLNGLTPILDVVVDTVEGDEVTYQISMEGQPDQLKKLIDLDEAMVAVPTGRRHQLRFRWMQ